MTFTHVNAWMTTKDRSKLLEQQPVIAFESESLQEAAERTITVDERRTYQQMDGCGASFTDASAWLVFRKLNPAARETVMKRLFDRNEGIGMSFLRQPMGASDFALRMYSYDDMPQGEADPDLERFSVGHDREYILPVLKEALSLNPDLKVMASPWSAPGWMKTTDSLVTGSVKPEYYEAFAQYFVRFIQAYKEEGIQIYAITPQNEPLYEPAHYPGMGMVGEQQRDFIKHHLGPAFRRNNLETKIMCYDHNWDRPDYPRTVFSDPEASQYVAGTGWHFYGGSHEAMSLIHDEFPEKEAWFTEGSGGEWIPDKFSEQIKHVIRIPRNWCKSVIWWNIALDEKNGPTVLPKSTCHGLLKIEQETGEVTYRIDYYTLGHISKFVQPGAYRIESDTFEDDVESVAFQNPDGSMALIVANRTPESKEVAVKWQGQSFRCPVPGDSAATFTWNSRE